MYPDEYIINTYKALCTKLGRPATQQDLKEAHEIPYDSFVIKYRFGSLTKLRKMLNISSTVHMSSRDEILTAIVKLYNQLGRKPTFKQIKNIDRMPSYPTLLQIFGFNSIKDFWIEIDRHKQRVEKPKPNTEHSSDIVNVLNMLRILRKGGLIQISEIAKALNVDGRSVRRYRDLLIKLGYSIPSRTGRYGGYELIENGMTEFEWNVLKDALKVYPNIYEKIENRFNGI